MCILNVKLVSVAKQRSRNKTIKFLLDTYMQAKNDDLEQDVELAHAYCGEDAKKLKAMIEAVNPNTNVVIQMLSPIIDAHTGSGMLGVIHWGRRNLL